MKKTVLLVFSLFATYIGFAQHWTPSGGFFGGMVVLGYATIDGVEQTDPTYFELACFIDGDCRGIYYSSDGWSEVGNDGVEHWCLYPTVYANADETGKDITFKLWDGEIEYESDITVTLSLEGDACVGCDGDFVEISFATPITGYNLDIIGYDGQSGNGYNWYLISSPIGEVDPLNVLGMIDPEDPDNNDGFDLFRFNQSADDEWENWKQVGDHHHFNLEPCKGYLYASGVDTRLTFVGDAYSGSGVVTLVKDDNANLAGWNLIGNPFAVPTTIGRDFYVMKADGTEIVTAETDQIAPMQGIFVVAERDGETVTFTPGASTDNGNKLVINVAQNRSGVIDRAIVRFGQGSQLPKFMLNPNNTKIYIPQADNEYAVVRSDNEAELPVNFKAAENGTYTFKVDANTSEMDYLHLIDNKNGNDIDLLENPSYTFEANTTDFANRFKLVFRNTTGIDENSEQFAFFNGHDWTVNNKGRATLQVIDMTGHLISTETLDNNAHVTIDAAPGVYMLQLSNGNDVKTQKVVIK